MFPFEIKKGFDTRKTEFLQMLIGLLLHVSEEKDEVHTLPLSPKMGAQTTIFFVSAICS